MKVGSIPWSPLAEGLLARPFDAGTKTKRGETDEYVSFALPDIKEILNVFKVDQ